ncbi:MAG: HAMP domain-containing histidine kinase [Planctomycetes bacterium]|nr:HAMP domain-containing histidine kinase [Planctomycetota bacterium]
MSAAWTELLEEGELIAPVGDRYAWNSDEAARPTRRAAVSVEAAAAGGSRRFATRLAAAEVLEIYDTDTGAALEQLLSALQDAELSAGQRAIARLRAIQLAGKDGRTDVVREQWSLASAELSGAETESGLPVLLACGLAAGRALPQEDRCAIATRLSAAWGAGELALEGEEPLVAVLGGTAPPVVSENARLGALARRVEELGAEANCVDESFARRRSAWIAAGLREVVGPLPEPLAVGRWEIHATPAGPFAVRGAADGARTGSFVDPAGLGNALAERLRRDAPESAHGEWVVEVAPGSLALADSFLGGWLRVRLDLSNGALPPEVRAAGRFASILRWSMLAAAASILLASFAIVRALARERRLAELKSTFIANVSHELRTPLASILLMAENLEEGRVSDPASQGRYHANIRREAQRLRRLVSDVLDFSRLERGAGPRLEREELDLGAWGTSVADEALDRGARDGVALGVDVAALHGEHGRIDGDALRRVVINLVDNALKYGGGEVRFAARVADGELELVVEDRGPGIPPAEREAVFDPFRRLDDGEGPAGTGLGLAIVRALVEAHGGRVSIGSGEDGRGARFEARVPLEAEQVEEGTA